METSKRITSWLSESDQVDYIGDRFTIRENTPPKGARDSILTDWLNGLNLRTKDLVFSPGKHETFCSDKPNEMFMVTVDRYTPWGKLLVGLMAELWNWKVEEDDPYGDSIDLHITVIA